FLFGDQLEVLRNEICRDTMEIEPLTARENCRQNLVRFRCSENEFHMWRRLFERLQQCVERLLGQHVYFVDDVDFVTALRRRVRHVVAQLAHIINAAVARAIDLDYVEAVACGYLLAVVTLSAGRNCWTLSAIE